VLSAAPPAATGQASGTSQTLNELGGALGIAVLGSVGTALYRSEVGDAIPATAPPEAAEAARDTLGGAIGAAGQLPATLLDTATQAFAHGLQLAALISAALLLVVAVIAARFLRESSTGETVVTPAVAPAES
jgi:DHA2 family multidrug resistance protein-like MFS transporter